MRTDPHQMAIMDALAERIRTIRSEGKATLALTHEGRVAQMPPRCAACHEPLTEDEQAWNYRNSAPGQSECFCCLDETAALTAHEVTYDPLPIGAVSLM